MAFPIPPPPRRPRRWVRPVLTVLAIVALVVLAAVVLRIGRDNYAQPSTTWTATPTPVGDHASDPRFLAARDQLAALPVKGWDRAHDYQRHRFGPAWSDDVGVEFGRNGCNTRDDILRRDLTDLVVRPNTCFADRGVLRDPYTATAISFVRGPTTSKSVEIDHVVSLSDAWYKGARNWDAQRRLEFANDPRNLLAVSPKANFDKAFRDAAGWLPSNEGFRCEFVVRQIDVKTSYGLWVSENEKRAMVEVLRSC